MSLRDDIGPYVDIDGYILPKPSGNTKWESGNALLYTGIHYYLLFQQNDITENDRIMFDSLVMRCTYTGEDTDGQFFLMGLLNRNPNNNTNLQGWDDYTSIALASKVLGDSTAKDIYDLGKHQFWNYNNISPHTFTFRTWFGRAPDFIGHLYRCAGHGTPLFCRAWTFFKTLFGSVGEHSGDILAWVRFQSDTDSLSYKIFKRKIKRKYGSIKNLFAASFGESHPFVKYVKED